MSGQRTLISILVYHTFSRMPNGLESNQHLDKILAAQSIIQTKEP